MLLARAEVQQCLLTHSLETHSAQLQTGSYAKVRLQKQEEEEQKMDVTSFPPSSFFVILTM